MTGRATNTPGMVLGTSEGRPYRFDPGALCLELLVTGGPAAPTPYEVLDRPAALVRWAGESRLAPGLGAVLAVGEADVRAARAVRDALLRITADRAGGHRFGRPADACDFAVLNAAAAEAPLVARVGADGAREWAPGATGAQLLSTVARDAVDLFTGPYADRIRECGTHNCYLLFVDTSRPGRRRWCAMERCGNLHKVRAHRARRTTAATTTP
ncbi:CGNR zinc finger domain-containing protein [Streptomyces sp. NPDC058665]|uniref:CGNR zinc finger domain-containing protein n=1 Tax=Streptomyces sp. NPDC058665 TaxID=3346586 RepID=UPI003661FA09